jgi:hypothetical protein
MEAFKIYGVTFLDIRQVIVFTPRNVCSGRAGQAGLPKVHGIALPVERDKF